MLAFKNSPSAVAKRVAPEDEKLSAEIKINAQRTKATKRKRRKKINNIACMSDPKSPISEKGAIVEEKKEEEKQSIPVSTPTTALPSAFGAFNLYQNYVQYAASASPPAQFQNPYMYPYPYPPFWYYNGLPIPMLQWPNQSPSAGQSLGGTYCPRMGTVLDKNIQAREATYKH